MSWKLIYLRDEDREGISFNLEKSKQHYPLLVSLCENHEEGTKVQKAGMFVIKYKEQEGIEKSFGNEGINYVYSKSCAKD